MSAPLDAFDHVAPVLKVRPELQNFCRFGGHWSSAHEPTDAGWAAFHIVTKGECKVERKGAKPVSLTAGDVLLLPHGDEHVVYGGDHLQQPTGVTRAYRDHITFAQSLDVDIETEVICGRLHLENATQNLILRALPNIILLQANGIRLYADLIEFIREELDGGKAGSTSVASGLASALFVMVLRQHIEIDPPTTGLFALLVARDTSRAAAGMVADPSKAWTLEELASAAAVSKATLVRAFRRLSGMPPLAFLTELRLGLARSRILYTPDHFGQIAVDVGYQTEAALSRAIFRRYTIRPGAMRRNSAAI